jgi:cell division septum initiation protein DivIVA
MGCRDGALVRDLRSEVEQLTHELQQAKDSVAHLQEGKPLGEMVGKQTIVNMAREIAALKAKLAEVENHRMERAISILKNIDPPAKGWIEIAVHERFMEALRAEMGAKP